MPQTNYRTAEILNKLQSCLRLIKLTKYWFA